MADAEVDRIVMEITQGQLAGVGSVPTTAPATVGTNVNEQVMRIEYIP